MAKIIVVLEDVGDGSLTVNTSSEPEVITEFSPAVEAAHYILGLLQKLGGGDGDCDCNRDCCDCDADCPCSMEEEECKDCGDCGCHKADSEE